MTDEGVLNNVDSTGPRSTRCPSRRMRRSQERPKNHEHLAVVEVELDRCWDLLRQRRARREFRQNPDDASVRDEGTVEGYLQ